MPGAALCGSNLVCANPAISQPTGRLGGGICFDLLIKEDFAFTWEWLMRKNILLFERNSDIYNDTVLSLYFSTNWNTLH